MLSNQEFSAILADLVDKRVTGVIDESQFDTQFKAALDDWGGSYITKASVALQIQELIVNVDLREDQTRDWWAGTADGGWDVTGTTPGGGHYPITNSLGVTTYKPCPAYVLSVTQKGDTGADAKRSISFFAGLQFADGELLFLHYCDATETFDVPLCRAYADLPPVADAVITVTNNENPWGTVTFTAGQKVGTVAIADPQVTAGDVLRFTAPAVRDTTLGDVNIVLSGSS